MHPTRFGPLLNYQLDPEMWNMRLDIRTNKLNKPQTTEPLPNSIYLFGNFIYS